MRKRKGEYLELVECFMVWFTQSRHNNIPIGALPILKKKAKLFATSLGITNFLASEGWLEKLRKRTCDWSYGKSMGWCDRRQRIGGICKQYTVYNNAVFKTSKHIDEYGKSMGYHYRRQ